MDFIQKRENDPEQYKQFKNSLKTVIAQRQIVIEQREREKGVIEKQVNNLSAKVNQLSSELASEKIKSSKQITNLSLALKQLEHQNEQLRNDKHELEFQMNVIKMKNQEQGKQHTKEVNKLKNDFESQKQILTQKISKLQKNLSTLNNHYHINQQINEDKHKIIQDANRNLRGFANEKQQRMIIIQNQQLTNEIQFQSRQITSLLQKNEKLQEEIKLFKLDLQLHRNIQNDLVKRSSLAQNLIKQLNNRIRELEGKVQVGGKDGGSRGSVRESKVGERGSSQGEQQSRVTEMSQSQSKKDIQELVAKLRFQNANLKNFNHFLETTQRNYNKKYESLGEIMAQHLEILLLNNKGQQQLIEGSNSITIDLNSIKTKDIKQWKPEQTQVILQLLITQIKPYISKSSLISFPEARNIKVSFVEQQNKDAVSLPKIIQDYEKNQNNDLAKKGGRFKDIPVDISTKILRSNLREWGTKVSYGANIPRTRRHASKSIIVQGQKQII